MQEAKAAAPFSPRLIRSGSSGKQGSSVPAADGTTAPVVAAEGAKAGRHDPGAYGDGERPGSVSAGWAGASGDQEASKHGKQPTSANARAGAPPTEMGAAGRVA
jgi:hypothetical protein